LTGVNKFVDPITDDGGDDGGKIPRVMTNKEGVKMTSTFNRKITG